MYKEFGVKSISAFQIGNSEQINETSAQKGFWSLNVNCLEAGMTCGIYQIINKTNGKSYVGLSRNIKRRWQQHTWGLHKENALEYGSYPLRAAFIKYEYAKHPERFDFRIIEKCQESRLLERETHWINELRPEYNITIYNPAKKSKARDFEPGEGIWLQYHNCDKLGYLPAESFSKDDDYSGVLTGVSTGKRAVLNTQGDTVFLVAGIGKNPKQYYLISRFIVEEICIRSEADPYEKGEMFYDAFGFGLVLNPPQLLNSKEFDKFRDYCGNFGFGLMSIRNSPYTKTLLSVSKKFGTDDPTYSEYVGSFYKSVMTVNPNERSALAGRGTALHFLISLSLPRAALVLEGTITKLIAIDPPESFINYRGLLFLHTFNLAQSDIEVDGKSLMQGYLNLLYNLGRDEKTFPGQAIQGFVKIKGVYKYTPKAFAADSAKHLLGERLEALTDKDVWCIEFETPQLLSKAVPLPTPEGIQDYDCWCPEYEDEVKAMRSALEDIFAVE